MPCRSRLSFFTCLFVMSVLLATLSACGMKQEEKVIVQPTSQPAEKPVEEIIVTQEVEKIVTQDVEKEVEATKVSAPEVGTTPSTLPTPIAQATKIPQPTATPVPITTPQPVQQPTQGPIIQPTSFPAEIRMVELEWPPRMRKGDSDTVRLSLLPSQDGYTLTTEFPEHTTLSQTVTIQRPGGYDLFAVASLDGIGFQLSPTGEQEHQVPVGEAVTWRWSISPRSTGPQRISITLLLRWKPHQRETGTVRESQVYSRSITVNVASFFGLTRGQAMTGGLFGLFFGSSISLFALAYKPQTRRTSLQTLTPNQRLAIEARPGITIHPHEHILLRALFNRYDRVTIESEFLSGYSGARTFLALPIRQDGRADAYTIVKIGERESIHQEYENYETFVKDTLPPITARIQHAPVIVPTLGLGTITANEYQNRAAIQYTFIGAPGMTPRSLHQVLLNDPDPILLDKLFETFGPNWWMQRHPYTFRLAQEYDRMLPTHYVIEPITGKGMTLDGKQPPMKYTLEVGARVTLHGFTHIERREDGVSLSLRGEATPGQPPVRVRWQGLNNPNGATGRITATRQTLLREFVTDLNLYGLPDPLIIMPGLLDERMRGTQSTIHGDLNLENILVGPGGFGPQGFVWLIDFAQTRDGHPLYDFAHLEAEIIAHILAAHLDDPAEYLHFLQDRKDASRNLDFALLNTLQAIASRCLFNPTQPREYQLALFMACLGALKFKHLNAHARQLLYLTAAHISQTI